MVYLAAWSTLSEWLGRSPHLGQWLRSPRLVDAQYLARLLLVSLFVQCVAASLCAVFARLLNTKTLTF
ncbi:hypothetical protein BCV70DRAFT_35499 [Testicularia cyperi]|uniref:Uncharacterized protein n=1 Tax=Testicularia cyperi TaxID=1882483 RepID=A0A317XK60_9BASI|nr:hypothetical protein BCV70DRAFT_35499 [Testicularia cyperi]